MVVYKAVGYKVAIALRVMCKVGALPHVAPATADVAFHLSNDPSDGVSTDRTGPVVFLFSIVVGRWSIGVWFSIC